MKGLLIILEGLRNELGLNVVIFLDLRYFLGFPDKCCFGDPFLTFIPNIVILLKDN